MLIYISLSSQIIGFAVFSTPNVDSYFSFSSASTGYQSVGRLSFLILVNIDPVGFFSEYIIYPGMIKNGATFTSKDPKYSKMSPSNM